MKYEYPLSLIFKITTLSNDFTVSDARDKPLFYVRQKMLKLVEEVNIYKDSREAQRLYTIEANTWLDFSAAYDFTDAGGQNLGKVARKGWASLFNAHYEVYDAQQNHTHTIREENAWIKVMDGLFSEIPFIGLLSGYLFHPAYLVTDKRGTVIVRLAKEASLVERRFKLEKKRGFTSQEDEERVLLSLSMMLLLERSRG